MVISNIWTYNLVNDTLNVTENFGLTTLSILLTSGTGTILGSRIANGIASQPISLTIGQTVNIVGSVNSNNLVGGLSIVTNGTIEIIGK
jgi:hypothetical protein